MFLALVVICFHFTIFVVLETTSTYLHPSRPGLWFAFILLSLSYWKQQYVYNVYHDGRCDLLSFYYLCRTGNNTSDNTAYCKSVVICFHFTIFVVLETTAYQLCQRRDSLWFAFILLSLSYWKQHKNQEQTQKQCCDLLSFYYLCRTGNNFVKKFSPLRGVVICFHFTIFVVLETTSHH